MQWVRLRKTGFLVMLLFWTAAAPLRSQSSTPARHDQLEANKKLVLEFFKPGDFDKKAQLLDEHYIQHNPRFVHFNEVHHTSGRQGFLAAIHSGILQPRPSRPGASGPPPRLPQREPALVMAEGDLVTVIWKRQLPDPDDKSKTYDAFQFDTFRVKNGKLAEHWDGATRQREP